MIAIIDSGGANIASVQFALERLGAESVLTRDAAEIAAADRVLLPGVGAAPVAMQTLKEAQLIEPVRKLRQPRPAAKYLSRHGLYGYHAATTFRSTLQHCRHEQSVHQRVQINSRQRHYCQIDQTDNCHHNHSQSKPSVEWVTPSCFQLFLIVDLPKAFTLFISFEDRIFDQFIQPELNGILHDSVYGVPPVVVVDTPAIEIPQLASKVVLVFRPIDDAPLLDDLTAIRAKPATHHRPSAIEIDLTNRSF